MERIGAHSRRGRAIAGVFGSLLLLVAIPLVLSLSQRPGKDGRQAQATIVPQITVAPRSTSAPSIQPVETSDLLFSIPVDAANMHSAYDLSGFAVADDGSLWIGDGNNRLLNYSLAGKLLRSIDLAVSLQPLNGLALRGAGIWVHSGSDGSGYVRKLDTSGRVLAEYRVPEIIGTGATREPPEKGMTGLAFGGNGELLIAKEYMSPYVQIVDTQGKLQPAILAGYPSGGKLYTAKTDGPPAEHRSTRQVTVGDVRVNVAVSGTLTSLRLLKVDTDGSFYVRAEEWIESAPPGSAEGSRQYVLQYSAEGQLLRHTRVLTSMQGLASGPDGAFYTLMPQLNARGVYTSVDVRRLNFFAAGQPLPLLPTSTATPVLPSLTPTNKPTPSSTPIQDLATLAAQSDLIVRARVVRMGVAQYTLYCTLKPEEWLKNPGGLIADRLSLRVPAGRDWSQETPVMVPVVLQTGKEGLLGEDSESGPDYIIFMRNSVPAENMGGSPVYRLTDEQSGKISNAGVFSILNGKIDYAGIPKYKGWTVDQFTAEIRRYAPTPVPVEKAAYDLSVQGQYARFIAEVEMVSRSPWKASVGPGARLLQQVRVLNWLKKDQWAADMLGLSLTQEEYDRMRQGSGHYILFLTNQGEQGVCPMGVPTDYFKMQGGQEGIFEIKDGKIGYSGIGGYEGYSLGKFEAVLRSAVPTPVPRPTAEGEQAPPPPMPTTESTRALPRFSGWVQESDLIAEVELLPGDGPTLTDPYWITATFKVQDWLKKPAWYSMDTVSVRVASYRACDFSLGKGPYIIFLRLDKNAQAGNPENSSYSYSIGAVYGLRDGIIEYGGYIGQPVVKVEADIRTAVAQPTRQP